MNTSESGQVCCAQWSPDGPVVVANGIRVLPTRLPTNPAYQWPAVLYISHPEPRWKTDLCSFISPDGNRVAYGNAKGEIYVISMDGGQPQKIVDKGANAANWSADGKVLVFQYDRDPAHPELQLLDLGTGQRSVVLGSQGLEGGQWVGEDTLVATPKNQTKLMIFDVRTQKWSDLVLGKVPGSVGNYAHSPDYKHVYYTTGGAADDSEPSKLGAGGKENRARGIVRGFSENCP